MRRVVGREAFTGWLRGALPGFADATPTTLFVPVPIDDRSDGHLVHLDGLNLSRAWCLYDIAFAASRSMPLAKLDR